MGQVNKVLLIDSLHELPNHQRNALDAFDLFLRPHELPFQAPIVVIRILRNKLGEYPKYLCSSLIYSSCRLIYLFCRSYQLSITPPIHQETIDGRSVHHPVSIIQEWVGLLKVSLKPFKLRIVVVIRDQTIIEGGSIGGVGERWRCGAFLNGDVCHDELYIYWRSFGCFWRFLGGWLWWWVDDWGVDEIKVERCSV